MQQHRHWDWVRRVLIAAFLLLVAVLLVRYARRIDWHDVWASVLALPPRVVLAAAGLAALSHLLYSCFDLIGRHYSRHTLPARKVMQVGFISYAFNLNMGSAVGGVGFRFRLYSGLGLRNSEIVRVLTLSMVTNWLGYFLLAGCLFSFAVLDLPPQWRIDNEQLSLVGLVLVALALVYLVLCAASRRRSWAVRGHEVFLPSLRMALVQLSLSCAHWLSIAATLWVLLQGQVSYGTVLAVFLAAAMAGVIIRVPAGLGVLEAVFIALLSHRIPEGRLLGALLGYRAIYYMVPLATAALLYLRMELHARRLGGIHGVATRASVKP